MSSSSSSTTVQPCVSAASLRFPVGEPPLNVIKAQAETLGGLSDLEACDGCHGSLRRHVAPLPESGVAFLAPELSWSSVEEPLVITCGLSFICIRARRGSVPLGRPRAVRRGCISGCRGKLPQRRAGSRVAQPAGREYGCVVSRVEPWRSPRDADSGTSRESTWRARCVRDLIANRATARNTRSRGRETGPRMGAAEVV
jgi:hypothetical protein